MNRMAPLPAETALDERRKAGMTRVPRFQRVLAGAAFLRRRE
jgi:hypothetical protein